MLEFNPQDPYPLLREGAHSHAEAQAHSAQVDHWLGLDTEAIESKIEPRKDQQMWVGLAVRSLLTPYTEIRAILDKISPQAGDMVVDLGAAYGRMGFVMAWHFPQSHFLGYELAQERVQAGLRLLRKWNCDHADLQLADLSDESFKPEAAPFYFVYDYGTRRAMDKTLADLREIAAHRPITVVGRGRLSRDAIEHGQPWLSQVVAPEHFKNFSIYRTH